MGKFGDTRLTFNKICDELTRNDPETYLIYMMSFVAHSVSKPRLKFILDLTNSSVGKNELGYFIFFLTKLILQF